MRHVALESILAVLLSAASVSAHHGYANFHLDETKTIQGTLVSETYGNPHVVLQLKADDGTVYAATWDSARTLQSCLTAATLKVGDYLTISGAPHMDPTRHELASLTEVRRQSDGWDWVRRDRKMGC